MSIDVSDEKALFFVEVSIIQFTKYHAGRPGVIDWKLKAGEAKSLLRQVLEGRQRKFGSNHPAC